MKTLFGIVFSTCLLAGGCINEGNTDNSGSTDRTNDCLTASATYSVVIGMENSRFAGSCPGAKYDSDRMYELLSKYSDSAFLLQDGKATRASVKEAIQNAVEKCGNGLFILYYSGHGGSDPFPDTGIEETDGSDEYLCLYDNYFRDNEIWSLISKCKGRTLIIADCCHSRTIYRAPKFTLSNSLPLCVTYNEQGPISMQCWSGCPDDTYSYGSSTGGQFTNTLLRYFKAELSYDELWQKIERDQSLKRYETVQRTKMGSDFGGQNVFR